MKKSIKSNDYYWHIYAISYYNEELFKCFVTCIPYSDTTDLEYTIRGVAILCGDQQPEPFMTAFHKVKKPLGRMNAFHFDGKREAWEDDSFWNDFKEFYYVRYGFKDKPSTYFPCFFIAELSKGPNQKPNLV
jgi:hypothetical protein